MSLCIRTISNKVTPFVGTRKAATRVDRQLPNHVEKTSTFFEEFLSGKADRIDVQEPSASSTLVTKLRKKALDDSIKWTYKLQSNNSWSIGKYRQAQLEDVSRRFCQDRGACKPSGIVLAVAGQHAVVQSDDTSNLQTKSQPDDPDRPRKDHEHLTIAYEALREALPNFFLGNNNYTIYHPQIVFENNFRGTVTVGMYHYIKQAAFLTIYGHLKFAYVKLDILKMTIHPEDNSVKVRWRIRGLKGSKVFFQFWNYKVWGLRKTIDSLEAWLDGFSTFYVNEEGKIVKHVADRMMPDQDNVVRSKSKTDDIAEKLTLFAGLPTPEDFFSSTAGPLSNRTLSHGTHAKTALSSSTQTA